MLNPNEQLPLGKSLLAGLLTGIITAVVILVFNVMYRKGNEFYTYDIVMPFSIFLFCPLFELLAGGVYYLIATHLRKGRMVFTTIFIVLTLVGALATAFTNNSHEEFTLAGFRGLFTGIELILGLLGAFLIPYFVRHPKLYMS
jgi:hypothetical protein